MGKALLVIVVVVMTIYAFFDVIATPRGSARRMSRLAWGIVVFVPVIGPLAWLAFGRPRGHRPRVRGPRRQAPAPDDDPEFLSELNRKPEDALQEWEKEFRRKRFRGETPE